ncbi:type VII secretion protein EccE [Streptomyces solincola]|uniref:type VII secretion protein EccE n=1 Tax=Streptomyces solincola TaxID=2100817 RepID=UPI0015E398D7|nr:type VII secretion protein EccE [Streptomyces solincola]
MGTAATRTREGRSGGRRPGGPGERSGPAPARGGAPASTALRPLPGSGKLGPVELRQLVLIELALALVAVGLAAGGPWLAAAATVAVLLLLLAVIRRRGRLLPDWLASSSALRARRRSARPAGPDTDASLAVVAESLPGFGPYPYVDRERRTVGMLGDGAFLTAVVRIEASGRALRPASGSRALPLSVLGGTLEVDDIRPESVQLLQQVRPAPAPHLPQQSVARLSYAPLQQSTGAPALRVTWVAVKLDPELCREAIAARGGGLAGAQRCLVRLADHVASRLSGVGFQAVVLDQEELNTAVAMAACASPRLAGRAERADGSAQRRTAETARVWRCDDRWHTTYAVGRWPELGRAATPLPALVSQLTSVPAYATTLSVTLRRGARQGTVEVAGHIRVTGGSDSELVGGRRALEAAARSAKVGLLRLDREQLPGALATLPLGGAR